MADVAADHLIEVQRLFGSLSCASRQSRIKQVLTPSTPAALMPDPVERVALLETMMAARSTNRGGRLL